MGVVLLTAGVGKKNFKDAAVRLAKSAHTSGFFSKIVVEDNQSLWKNHSSFLKSHEEFINRVDNARGYGHYLWKPYLVNYWLERLGNDDVLLFLDAGCHINYSTTRAINRFQEYIELAIQNNGLSMQIRDFSFGYEDLRELAWTRQDLLNFLGADNQIRNSNQIQSGIIFLSKTEKTLRYSSKWLDVCLHNNYLFLDDNRIARDEPFLIESRWEQSVHSVLFKKSGFKCIPDEGTFGNFWPPDWRNLGIDYPIWAMRNRSGIDPFNFRLREIHMYFRRYFKN